MLDLTEVPGIVYNTKSPKYFIKAQNDLYQIHEIAKFLPLFGLLSAFVVLWQFIATGLCALGAWIFWPVGWLEQNVVGGNRERRLADAVDGT